jgi:hypothetical protein
MGKFDLRRRYECGRVVMKESFFEYDFGTIIELKFNSEAKIDADIEVGFDCDHVICYRGNDEYIFPRARKSETCIIGVKKYVKE